MLNKEKDSSLRRAFGLKEGQQVYPQRISELHEMLGGKEEKEKWHQYLRDIVCKQLEIKQLSEEDVELVATNNTFDPVLNEVGQGYGFDYFLTYLFWQGILGQIEEALTEELKPNGYSVRDLFFSYLGRLDEVVKTQDDLEVKLRNELWSGQAKVAPVSQTVVKFLLKLDLNKLEMLYHNRVRKTHRGKKKIVVAIDAVLLELFGKYEHRF